MKSIIHDFSIDFQGYFQMMFKQNFPFKYKFSIIYLIFAFFQKFLTITDVCPDNNNNNHLYFTRVTQSNTGFDFRCGPVVFRGFGVYIMPKHPAGTPRHSSRPLLVTSPTGN